MVFSQYTGVFVMQGWNPVPGWMLRAVRVDPETRQHPTRLLLVFLIFKDIKSSLVFSQLVPLVVSSLFGGFGSLDFAGLIPLFRYGGFGLLVLWILDLVFVFLFSGNNLWGLILGSHQLIQKWCMQCGDNFIF